MPRLLDHLLDPSRSRSRSSYFPQKSIMQFSDLTEDEIKIQIRAKLKSAKNQHRQDEQRICRLKDELEKKEDEITSLKSIIREYQSSSDDSENVDANNVPRKNSSPNPTRTGSKQDPFNKVRPIVLKKDQESSEVQQLRETISQYKKQNENLKHALEHRPTWREWRDCKHEKEVMVLQHRLGQKLKSKSQRMKKSSANLHQDKLTSRMFLDYQNDMNEAGCTLTFEGQTIGTNPNLGLILGQACAQVVQASCAELQLECVADLVPEIKKMSRLVPTIEMHHQFAEGMGNLLAVVERETEQTPTRKDTQTLKMIFKQMKQIMKRYLVLVKCQSNSGLAAHELMLQCMDLVHVSKVTEIVPKLKMSLNELRKREQFIQSIRRSMNLRPGVTLDEILETFREYLHRLGFHREPVIQRDY